MHATETGAALIIDRLVEAAEGWAVLVARRFVPDGSVLRDVARDCLLGWSVDPCLAASAPPAARGTSPAPPPALPVYGSALMSAPSVLSASTKPG